MKQSSSKGPPRAMSSPSTTAGKRHPVWDAHFVAATATRRRIAEAIEQSSGASRDLLAAISTLHDGHVDAAIASLQRIIRRWPDRDVRAASADFLAPLFVSRHRSEEIGALADILEAAGRDAEAHAFRALIHARKGLGESATRSALLAIRAIDNQDDLLIRSRVLQRLALAAFYTNEFTVALERARESAAISTMIGADRAAATCYTITYSIHHEVTGDFAEASYYAGLWREAASRAGDTSMLQAAVAAEYELAVQFADSDRITLLETELRSKPLPQLYYERFPIAVSHALVMGSKDIASMRTVLSAIRDTDRRSRGEWAYCGALISLAFAAERADDKARDEIKRVISRLGRASSSEPAYERQYRRIARAVVASCCVIIGDLVYAQRIISVKEMEPYPAARDLPTLVQKEALGQVDDSLRGVRNVIVLAGTMRANSAIPAGLTLAEIEVLRLLGHGWSAIRIARETGRSVNTVYSHSRSILEKLNASRSPEAVAIARSLGIIT